MDKIVVHMFECHAISPEEMTTNMKSKTKEVHILPI